MHIFNSKQWKKISDKSSRFQVCLLATFVILSMVLSYRVWFYPKYSQRLILETEEKRLRKELSVEKHRWKQHQKLLISIKTLENELTNVTRHWVSSEKMSDSVQMLFYFCKQSGLSITLFAQQSLIPFDFHESFSIKMSIIGSYPQFLAFLKKIVALDQGITFESLEIRPLNNMKTRATPLDLLQVEVVWLIPVRQTFREHSRLNEEDVAL